MFAEEDYAKPFIGEFNPDDRKDVLYLKWAAGQFIQEVHRNCPEGRRRSLAVTHIETAAMFAVKSLFDG